MGLEMNTGLRHPRSCVEADCLRANIFNPAEEFFGARVVFFNPKIQPSTVLIVHAAVVGCRPFLDTRLLLKLDSAGFAAGFAGLEGAQEGPFNRSASEGNNLGWLVWQEEFSKSGS